ncbi:DMT family transporter [Deinococcus multiflagellatus]|uniref:DMT family transporter n=2 Tax=Deinococcus multiflagellatus TaxID=1656887 RepID=A0ABW1ZIH2_9DEIO
MTGLLLHAGYLGGVTVAIRLGLPAGVTSVLVGLQPLLTALLSGPVLGETVTARQWTGLGLGFAGVLLVVAGRPGGGGTLSQGALLAAGVALACTTAGTLYQRRFGAGMPLLGGTTVQYLASAGLVGGLLLAQGGGTIHWNTEFILSLTWLVLVLSVGAILLLMRLLRDLPAAQVGSLFYLVPPLAVLEAFVLYGERLGWWSLLGLALCVLGVALAAQPAAPRRVLPGMGELHGRIGGVSLGYDLHASWDGRQLSGRIGGRFEGKDIELSVNAGGVEGRIGGTFAGFDAVGELSPQAVHVRLGGRIDGDDVHLQLGGAQVQGRFSGRLDGKDVALTQDGARLHGRIGGRFEGKDVDLTTGGVPLEVAALAAVCAYKALEDQQAQAASANSGPSN